MGFKGHFGHNNKIRQCIIVTDEYRLLNSEAIEKIQKKSSLLLGSLKTYSDVF